MLRFDLGHGSRLVLLAACLCVSPACESDGGGGGGGSGAAAAECLEFVDVYCDQVAACADMSFDACAEGMDDALPGGCAEADSIRAPAAFEECKTQIGSWSCAEFLSRAQNKNLPDSCEDQLQYVR